MEQPVSPNYDKTSLFRDAFRGSSPGGRLAISDIVATARLPEEDHQDLTPISGCGGEGFVVSVAIEAVKPGA